MHLVKEKYFYEMDRISGKWFCQSHVRGTLTLDFSFLCIEISSIEKLKSLLSPGLLDGMGSDWFDARKGSENSFEKIWVSVIGLKSVAFVGGRRVEGVERVDFN